MGISVPREIVRLRSPRHALRELQKPAGIRLKPQTFRPVFCEPLWCQHHPPVSAHQPQAFVEHSMCVLAQCQPVHPSCAPQSKPENSRNNSFSHWQKGITSSAVWGLLPDSLRLDKPSNQSHNAKSSGKTLLQPTRMVGNVSFSRIPKITWT